MNEEQWIRAETLGMGDSYRVSNTAPVHTIQWTNHLTNGAFFFDHAGTDERASKDYYGTEKVQLVHAAPRCGCGRRFESCENGCPWPKEVENAYFGRI